MAVAHHVQDTQLVQHLKDIRKELTKLYAEPAVKRVLDEQTEVQKWKERVAELEADLARLKSDDQGSEEHSANDETRGLLRDKCIALERSEARVEKLKLAFTKSTNKFRDGISELLGWRIEQLDAGQWGVASVYRPEEGKLLFQQTEEGFELLDSPWARSLQEDRPAMAFLRMFNSAPGFLAYVVQDLIQTKTLA